MNDIVVTVTNPGAANVSLSNGSVVNATVGNGGVVNVAIGTISPGNATVVAGSLTINSTSTLSYGNAAYVKNVGTSYAASLDIGIPAGPPTTVLVGNTTTLSSGNASVTGVANGSNLTLSFAIPRGASGLNGVTPSFAVGNVTTLAAGGSATVTATPSNGGANVVLDFGIPRGVDGTGGGSSNLTVSDAVPSNLGVASAGTSNLASRSDHVHNLPVIAWANLSGVPSNFPSNIGSVSGLQAVLDAKQAAGNYLTLSDTIDGGDYTGTLVYGITFNTQPQSVSATSTTNITLAALNITANAPTQGAAAINGALLSVVGSSKLINGTSYSNVTFSGVVSTSNGSAWSTVFSDTANAGLISGLPDMPLTAATNGTRTVMAGYKIAYSDSPTTSGSWVASNYAFYAGSLPYGVTYNGQRFVAVAPSFGFGINKKVLTVLSSSDGANWTSRTLPQPGNNNTYPSTACRKPIVSVNGTVIVAGLAPTNSGTTTIWYPYLWTSSDGVSWTATQFGSPYSTQDSTGTFTFDLFSDMASSGVLAIGINGTTARYTADGVTWGTSTLPISCDRISYAAGRFWAFNGSSSGTDVCHSADGRAWALGTMPTSANWDAMAGGSVAFAGSSSGQYAQATIGTTYASANLTVSATATGGASVAYQWQSSLDAGTTWSDINGATNTTLSLSNLTQANNGTRYRSVASSTGAALGYSQSATLTVTG